MNISGENDWQIVPKVYVGPPIRKINWGGGNRFLAINSVRQAFILTEQVSLTVFIFINMTQTLNQEAQTQMSSNKVLWAK
jgi:hypothetical protein